MPGKSQRPGLRCPDGVKVDMGGSEYWRAVLNGDHPGLRIVSEQACLAAGIAVDKLERRELQLKGRAEIVPVRVITAASILD